MTTYRQRHIHVARATTSEFQLTAVVLRTSN